MTDTRTAARTVATTIATHPHVGGVLTAAHVHPLEAMLLRSRLERHGRGGTLLDDDDPPAVIDAAFHAALTALAGDGQLDVTEAASVVAAGLAAERQRINRLVG